MVLNEGLRLGLWGLLAGLLASAALVRALQSELFDVVVWDPVTYIGVAVLLLVVTGLASYVPAAARDARRPAARRCATNSWACRRRRGAR